MVVNLKGKCISIHTSGDVIPIVVFSVKMKSDTRRREVVEVT